MIPLYYNFGNQEFMGDSDYDPEINMPESREIYFVAYYTPKTYEIEFARNDKNDTGYGSTKAYYEQIDKTYSEQKYEENAFRSVVTFDDPSSWYNMDQLNLDRLGYTFTGWAAVGGALITGDEYKEIYEENKIYHMQENKPNAYILWEHEKVYTFDYTMYMAMFGYDDCTSDNSERQHIYMMENY